MGNHLDDIADRWPAIGDPGPSLTLTLRVKRYDIGLALHPAKDGAPCAALLKWSGSDASSTGALPASGFRRCAFYGLVARPLPDRRSPRAPVALLKPWPPDQASLPIQGQTASATPAQPVAYANA